LGPFNQRLLGYESGARDSNSRGGGASARVEDVGKGYTSYTSKGYTSEGCCKTGD
jgi:hypothetical protein